MRTTEIIHNTDSNAEYNKAWNHKKYPKCPTHGWKCWIFFAEGVDWIHAKKNGKIFTKYDRSWKNFRESQYKTIEYTSSIV